MNVDMLYIWSTSLSLLHHVKLRHNVSKAENGATQGNKIFVINFVLHDEQQIEFCHL